MTRTQKTLLAAAVAMSTLALVLVVGVLARPTVIDVLAEVARRSLGTVPRVTLEPLTIVRDVRSLSRLESASITLEKTVYSTRADDVLWGVLGESMEYVAVGEVIAGVDLSELSEGDVRVDSGGSVAIHLPDPVVLVVDLDEQRSRVVLRDVGLLASPHPQLETEARRAAEDALRAEAVRLGILDDAREGARDTVWRLLVAAGATSVEFVAVPPGSSS